MANNKREKFINLAEKRVNSAIKNIRLIGNLSNRKNYDYTDMHAKEIINALENEIKELKRRFSSKSSNNGNEFHFKS